jgi:hypothetical protein
MIEQGNGNLFLPDFNRSQLGAIIGTMEILGIPVLLKDIQRELRNTDSDLQAMLEIALRNRYEIKTVTGIGIAKNASPIPIISRFLEQIGYGLTWIGTEKIARKQIRVYEVFRTHDGREEVFKQWLLRDEKVPGSSEFWFEDYSNLINKRPEAKETETSNYIQLSLDL